MSALSKSKKASCTSLAHSASMDGSGFGGGGGGGAFTETTAVGVGEPPGPGAVMVEVVESVGEAFVEPSAGTVATPGSIGSVGAAVVFQGNGEGAAVLRER